MASITEILAAQAKAVRAGQDKISAADHLEAAAKLLRAEAGKPGNFIADIREAKKNRLEKFSQNVIAGEAKELDENMRVNGWLLGQTIEKTGVRIYGRKDMPDYKVQVKNGTFSILHKGDVQTAGIHLKDPHTLKFINPSKFIKQ